MSRRRPEIFLNVVLVNGLGERDELTLTPYALICAADDWLVVSCKHGFVRREKSNRCP